MTTHGDEHRAAGDRERYASHFGLGCLLGHFGRRTAGAEAGFFLPHLAPGMRLLDCGCGPGTITLGLAAAVAPGEVLGVDTNASALDRARTNVADAALANVRFEVGDVYRLPFDDGSFDAVFAHAVMEHLREPVVALRELRRVLRPGGVVGVRSPDYGAYVVAPADPVIDRMIDVHVRLRAHRGGNARVGRLLRGFLVDAGFHDVVASSSCDHYGTSESVATFRDLVGSFILSDAYGGTALDLGWTDRAELERMVAAWRTWAEHPSAFYAVTWCEAVGWG